MRIRACKAPVNKSYKKSPTEGKAVGPMPFGQIVGSTFDLIVEVTFQGASLVNTKEMAVGDMVTFDLGFDKKKNKPEAINIHKARMLTHDIRCFFEKNCA